ncbi:MAG: hypothetical protein PHP44_02425 [Kiritimatiellae bacterium]|nr:hypothetical protein [Kiritimatiellia bacterium]
MSSVFRMALTALCFAAFPVRGMEWDEVTAPTSGSCQLWGDSEEDRYWFWAVECPIEPAVWRISTVAGVDIPIENLPEDKILNCRYGPVTLDELLDRLGLSYGLIYKRNITGQLLASEALLLGFGLPPEWAARVREIRRLIGNLYDDDIRFNAEEAKSALYSLGEEAVPFLEETVLHGDCQAKNMAGMILTWMDDYTNPPPAVLEYYFAALSGEDTLYGLPCNYPDNAAWSVRFFERHPELTERIIPQLVGGLGSSDGQMRLLSAYLLSMNKHWEYVPQMAPVFAMHLKDNRLGGDAVISTHALTAMGNMARPWVLPLLESDDEQQRKSAALILYHIDNPAAEPKRSDLSDAVYDPAIQTRELHMSNWSPENFPDIHGGYLTETP